MNTTIEAEIITRNEPMLKQIVAVFMRKVRASHRGGMIDREHMLQEVKLCFMLEMRRYGEEIAVTHKRILFHALYQATIAAQPVMFITSIEFFIFRRDSIYFLVKS